MSKDRTKFQGKITYHILSQKQLLLLIWKYPFSKKILVTFTSDFLTIGQKIYQIDKKYLPVWYVTSLCA